MKAVVSQMKKSVHFNDNLEKYLGNDMSLSSKDKVAHKSNQIDDMDYHTLKIEVVIRNDTYGTQPKCCTNIATDIWSMISQSIPSHVDL